MAIPVVISSGATTSAGFTWPRSRPFCIDVPSQSAVGVFVEFSQTSGGPAFSRLQRADGTGLDYVVSSGGGNAMGVVLVPATPWARLAVSAAATSPMSYTVNELLT